MIVTNIEEITKQKVKIEIDGMFAFVLYKGEPRLYHVRLNQELKEEDYKEITEVVLPKRAKLRAMNLLKARSYTEKQLRDKLIAGQYPDGIIEEAISYVKQYGYINDRNYATDYIEYYFDKRSRRKILFDLMQKGIDKNLVEDLFNEKMEISSEECENREINNEINMAVELLRKKNFDYSKATPKEIQKMSAFLYRKGFESDTIRGALLLDITSI